MEGAAGSAKDNRGLRLNRYQHGNSNGEVCKQLNQLEYFNSLARDGCKFLNLSGESTDSDPVEVAARCKSRLRASLGVLGHTAIFYPKQTVWFLEMPNFIEGFRTRLSGDSTLETAAIRCFPLSLVKTGNSNPKDFGFRACYP